MFSPHDGGKRYIWVAEVAAGQRQGDLDYQVDQQGADQQAQHPLYQRTDADQPQAPHHRAKEGKQDLFGVQN